MSVTFACVCQGVHSRVVFLRRHPIAKYADFVVAVARSKHPIFAIIGPMPRKTRVDGGKLESTETGDMHEWATHQKPAFENILRPVATNKRCGVPVTERRIPERYFEEIVIIDFFVFMHDHSFCMP